MLKASLWIFPISSLTLCISSVKDLSDCSVKLQLFISFLAKNGVFFLYSVLGMAKGLREPIVQNRILQNKQIINKKASVFPRVRSTPYVLCIIFTILLTSVMFFKNCCETLLKSNFWNIICTVSFGCVPQHWLQECSPRSWSGEFSNGCVSEDWQYHRSHNFICVIFMPHGLCFLNRGLVLQNRYIKK